MVLVVGQYNLVLIGIEWYWVSKMLLCLYMLKKLMVTSTDQPTKGQIWSNLPFRKLENRKKGRDLQLENEDSSASQRHELIA